MGTREQPGPHRYDWSFSGLKTAVARAVEQYEAAGLEVPVADIAASFQEAVVDVITAKAVLACTEHGIGTLLLGGLCIGFAQLEAMDGPFIGLSERVAANTESVWPLLIVLALVLRGRRARPTACASTRTSPTRRSTGWSPAATCCSCPASTSRAG